MKLANAHVLLIRQGAQSHPLRQSDQAIFVAWSWNLYREVVAHEPIDQRCGHDLRQRLTRSEGS
jgi:hypothetical protein